MLIAADARRIPLPDNSVQCVVTSPPYWGLRKYAGEQELLWGEERCPTVGVDGFRHEWIDTSVKNQNAGGGLKKELEHVGIQFEDRMIPGSTCRRCGAWRGAYGLEPAVELYIAHTVEILREIRRVLRPDGVCFWNIGDSYSGSGRGPTGHNGIGDQAKRQGFDSSVQRVTDGLKPKDLCLIPERVALAAQADGWWVRSRIIWAKPNPMPESVTDRPTDAAEHIWMLTKQPHYYWDAEAVRERSEDKQERTYGEHEATWRYQPESSRLSDDGGKIYGAPNGQRNLRNVWMFATQPQPDYACLCGAVYPSRRNMDRRIVKDENDEDRTEYRCAGCLSWTDWISHFATFPEELPRRCILAATSARGACRFCGTPWERVTETLRNGESCRTLTLEAAGVGPGAPRLGQNILDDSQTTGWTPGCRCLGQHGRTVPSLVLDPFGGSGTTARVATELNRHAVSLDIAYGHPTGYAALADARTRGVQRNLPTV